MDTCVIDTQYAYALVQNTWTDNTKYTVEWCFNMKKKTIWNRPTFSHKEHLGVINVGDQGTNVKPWIVFVWGGEGGSFPLDWAK